MEHLSRWVGKRESFEDTTGNFIKEIRDDIKKIFDRLPPPVATSKSPLKLSEFGQSISSEVKASDWARGKAPDLLVSVKGKHPYEIQDFCYGMVFSEDFAKEDIYPLAKECAYNRGIKVSQVQEVLALELRDALLELIPD